MVNNGATGQQLMHKFNWKSEKMANEYVRDSMPFKRQAAELLTGFEVSKPKVARIPSHTITSGALDIPVENVENSIGKYISIGFFGNIIFFSEFVIIIFCKPKFL